MSANWNVYPTVAAFVMVSGTATPTVYHWDYVAYKLSVTVPNQTPNLYPLPHARPQPYPAGTRADAASSFYSVVYDWADHDLATPAAFYLPYPLGESSVLVRRDWLYLTKS